MAERTPPLTVRQVIEKLQAMDQDLPVLAEGCDCINPATDVKTMDYKGVSGFNEVVLIEVIP